MNPTDVLSNEHRVIEQVLDCLERLADDCAVNGRLDGTSAREALEFFRHFADHCHHGKEEGYLFPVLEARGFPQTSGPTGVMRDEHEQGRLHLRGMAESLDGAAVGEAADIQSFLRHAWAYISLLRQHIEKEDRILFPMANRALKAADQRELLALFDRAEAEHPEAHERCLRLASELADRWGVPPAEVTAPACGHCRHHAE
jgi:hemerythrin-like domain-containing protein